MSRPSLSVEDRRALDLLLDRSSAVAGSGAAGYSDPGVSQERLAGVERVLRTLDMMPATEPPADLLDRTLRRIGESLNEFQPAHPTFGDVLKGGQQAHA